MLGDGFPGFFRSLAAQKAASQLFRQFYPRLIEGIDAEQFAGKGGLKLQQLKEHAEVEVIDLRQRPAAVRAAGTGERRLGGALLDVQQL